MKIKMKSSKKLTGLFCLILAMFLISTTLLPIYTCDSFQTNNEVGETTYELVYKTEDDSFLEHSSYQVIEEYESFYLIKSSQIDYHTTNEYQLPTLNTNLNEVRLQRETIDTSSRPQTHSSYEDYDGLYLVQSIGPIKSEWRDELASTGDIHGYFPENTYLMDLSADKLEGMEEKDFVQWVGEFKTEYRVCPELDEIEGKENLNIVVYEELEKIIPELDAFGDIYDYGGQRVRMEADMDHVDLIAEVEGVQWIEVHREVELMNHDAQWTVQSGEPEIRSIWDQGITGEGQMVGVADTGIDYTHAQFRDPDDNPIGPDHRKIETYVEFAGDFDGHGHGTHVSGTIAGNDEIVGDSQPYEGVAKNARLSKYDIGTDSGGLQLPSPISDIFEVAYEDGARIHSNSWGSLDSYYTSDAAVVDEFMWDNKDMLILYAAGNSGDGENTIASPATAKNVLSVGASGVGDREVSQNDMASFSSRGPTDDGRLKPEVVAPGQGSVGYYEGLDIVSAESDGDPDTYHNSYTDKRGTSMSCPAVAGAATLVREYFEDGHYPGGGIENPSAALVKSVLVNSAEEITGEGTYANSNEFPNNDQGFGRVTLDNALEFEGDQRNLKVHDDIIGLFTGESDTHTLHVEDSSEPLEVSLAYTDYPGTPGASNVLVNDLNLRVESPTGEEYKGNVFEGTNPGQSSTGGEYDDLNPTQNVLRLEPEPGEWEVEVIAGNVPEGPQPYALAMTGSFNEIDQGPLSVDFDHEPLLPKEGETVQFHDTSSSSEGEIIDWYWDFDDGTTSTEQNPNHSFEEKGIYDVNLTVIDNNGETGSVVSQIMIKEPEYCEVEGGNTNYEYITNVKFNGIDRDSGDDGGYADHTDSVSDPVEPGETYELSVTMNTGGFTNYATAVIDWSQDYLLGNEEVIKIGYGSDDPLTVSTEITVPEDVENGKTRMRVMNKYNDYHLDPCEDQNYGETEDYTVKIGGEETPPEGPEADFDYEPDVPYQNEIIQFKDSSSEGDGDIVGWNWDFGDGTTSAEHEPTHAYEDEGLYTVELEVVDENGLADTVSKEIIIESELKGPEADLSFTPEEPEEDEEVKFTDESIEGDGSIVEWTWDFGDGETSTEQEPTYVYDEEGTYTVELRVVDENELDDEISKEIDVKQLEPPEADFAFSPEQPKEGEALQFTDESTEGDGSIVEWTWDFGDGITSEKQSPTHYYSEAGTYLVELNVTDDNDLFGSTTRSIEVQEKEESGEYCEVEGGDTSWGEYITNVEFNGIDKTSGDDGGYADHTDYVSDPVVPGESYELSVTVSTGGFSSYVSVVIDWSQNHELSDEEVIEVGHGNSDPLTVKTMVTVPEDAEEGKTRMRVMQEFNRYHDEPCEDQNYGETEDYTVKIGDGDLDYSGLDHRQEPEENRDEEMKIEKLHIFDRYKLITYVVASALLSTIFLKSEKLKIPYLK